MLATNLNSVPKPTLFLGLAGVIPFIVCAFAVWSNIGWVQQQGLFLQLGYAAVIVTFLGGVHWGRALAPDQSIEWPRLLWSVAPSLIGWAALAMHPIPALLILIAAFALAFIVDRHGVRTHFFPDWYLGLRKFLSLGAMAALIATLIRIWTLPA